MISQSVNTTDLKIKKARKINMMNFDKPAGYDEVQAGGEYTPIELGGHKLRILQLEAAEARTGAKFIKVHFDTAPDDIQPGYYTEQYKEDTRDQKKWGGVAVLFPTDKDGRTSKSFKQFCTSIEHSNNSSISWGAGFEASIVGKAIGGVFGEEEYINAQGEVKTARKLFWWRSVDGVADAKIPNKRTVESTAPSEFMASGFMGIPDGIEEDLPFK